MNYQEIVDRKKLVHEQMLEITKLMPMKQINVHESPYLHRYFAGRFSDGKDLWLHNFLSKDGDEHAHNHPFEFKTLVVNGGLTEAIHTDLGIDYQIRIAKPSFDYVHFLKIQLAVLSNPIIENRQSSSVFEVRMGGADKSVSVFDWHRIAAVEDMTWTAVIVDHKRLPQWYFKDGSNIEPVKSSPRDWYKNYAFRPDSGVCAGNDDNSLHNLF